nr:cell wall hydrolase [uncultured Sphingomonas sp.]
MSLRTALLVAATLTASTVAPAKVGQQVEPLIEQGSSQLPVVAAVLPLPTEEQAQSPVVVETPVNNSDNDQKDDDSSVDRSASLSEKVAQLANSVPGSRELECLAGAIYFEAKSETLQGQLAVGHVIANRADSGRFPASYCGVVFQRSQFSFVRGRSLPYIPRSSSQWKTAVAIAKIVDGNLQASPVGKALFFHARRVSPGWRLTRVSTLGNHVFYR